MEQQNESNEVTFNGNKTQDQYLNPNNNCVKDEEEIQGFIKSTHLTENKVIVFDTLCMTFLM